MIGDLSHWWMKSSIFHDLLRKWVWYLPHHTPAYQATLLPLPFQSSNTIIISLISEYSDSFTSSEAHDSAAPIDWAEGDGREKASGSEASEIATLHPEFYAVIGCSESKGSRNLFGREKVLVCGLRTPPRSLSFQFSCRWAIWDDHFQLWGCWIQEDCRSYFREYCSEEFLSSSWSSLCCLISIGELLSSPSPCLVSALRIVFLHS